MAGTLAAGARIALKPASFESAGSEKGSYASWLNLGDANPARIGALLGARFAQNAVAPQAGALTPPQQLTALETQLGLNEDQIKAARASYITGVSAEDNLAAAGFNL